jgi:dephospho-CoA kinase
MIVIGLTGSIGMGKSTAAKMLRRLGIPVFDSDATVRRALSPKGDAFEEVAVTFPECWNKKKHQIDRQKLGQIVFDDPQQRAVLESILHPIVWAGQRRFIAAMRRMGKQMVVLDIPLLFETNGQTRVDVTICMTAPFDIQRRRVLSRGGMDEGRFEKIISLQLPDSHKRARADFVVSTGLGYALTFRMLKNIIQSVKRGGQNA